VLRGVAVRTVIAANLLWAVGSIAVVATGLGDPTTIGALWNVLQAAVVAAFALLQLTGLRRAVSG
jgi:hypothetical protein